MEVEGKSCDALIEGKSCDALIEGKSYLRCTDPVTKKLEFGNFQLKSLNMTGTLSRHSPGASNNEYCIVPLFQFFPSYFPKNISSPYFRSNYVWLNSRFLLASYLDHDAFVHYALHVLDAPA